MRQQCLTAALLALLVFAGCANDDDTASSYPSRPIKIVVPFAAGGGTDAFARIIKKAIEENNLLSQPLVIVNVGGASGTIGSRRVKNARPDGYTVLLLHDAIVMAKYSGKVAYGPRAFEPVAGTSQNGTVVVMSQDSEREWKTLKDAVDEAEANPDTVTFGCNLGTPTHYVGLLLERERPGAAFRFVQSGDGAKRFHDLKGGHIDLTVFSNEEYLRYKEEGIQALAYFAEERHPLMPDVPTAIEQGFDAQAGIMQYWWMPKGTPQERVDVFAAALEQALDTPTVQNWLANVQSDPTFVQGNALKQRIEHLEQQVGTVNLQERVDMPNLPAWITAGVVVLSLLTGLRTLRSGTAAGGSSSKISKSHYGLLLYSALLVLLYVLALAIDINGNSIGFRTATLIFVIALGMLLSHHHRRSAPLVIVLALLLAFGLSYLLTQVFVIDLP
mgnify:CR=1 FL=1